jgi:hypothetical protein
MVERFAAGPGDAARDVRQKAHDRAQQRGLARAIGPEDRADLSFVHPQRDVGDDRRTAGIGSRDLAQLDHGVR